MIEKDCYYSLTVAQRRDCDNDNKCVKCDTGSDCNTINKVCKVCSSDQDSKCITDPTSITDSIPCESDCFTKLEGMARFQFSVFF